MKSTVLLFTIVFLFFSNNIFCQDSITNKVIIFDNNDINKVITKNDSSITCKKNAIKINPLLFIRGEIPIYYERAISKSFSVEAAIGITLKDYFGSLLDHEDIPLSLMDADITEKIKPNISFKLGLRYYTNGLVFDGSYFALEFTKRNYDLEMNIVKNIPYIDMTTFTFFNDTTNYSFNEKRYHNEIKLIYGYQNFYYWNSMFFDFYIGTGIDFYYEERIDEVVSNRLDKRAEYEIVINRKILPKFYFGVKYGFVF